MLGVAGGGAGLLLDLGFELAASGIIAGGVGISVAAYVIATRAAGAEPDGTTEVAAVLVVALGVLAGLGWYVLASGAASVIVLALVEKEKLHALVKNLREDELRAAMRFGVLALVILPLLPVGPLLGPVQLRPRSLWMIVLFFSALNFVGFVIRRAIGAGRGFGVLGMLGGLISSTAVTLDFSRRSRREPILASSLASGVVGACTVLIPRVLVVSAVLDARVALALLPLLAPALAIGAWLVWRNWRASAPSAEAEAPPEDKNPLRFKLALEMAVAFQLAMTVIDYVREHWAAPGVYATAVALGLTDVDALTVGMTRSATDLGIGVTARAIAIGILTNTIFKLVLSSTLGAPRFRRATAVALAGMAAVMLLAIWLRPA